MEEAIKSLVVKLGASSGAIMVLDERANLLRCGASYNMPDVWVRLTNLVEKSPTNTNGNVAYTGKSEIVNHLNKLFHGHFIYSLIVVPIKDAGKVIANIEIITDDPTKTFNSADQEFLEAAAKDLRALVLQSSPTQSPPH